MYLIPGTKNDINSMLKEIDLSTQYLPKYFGINEEIALNYFVYDVDLVNLVQFDLFTKKFNNLQEGMIILSNPSIEVLADFIKEPHTGSPSNYKNKVRDQLIKSNYIKVTNIHTFVIDNIFPLLIKELDSNRLLFHSEDVYEHVEQSFVVIHENNIDLINKEYRYVNLFSLLYIILADIFKLYKHNNNVEVLKKRLQNIK